MYLNSADYRRIHIAYVYYAQAHFCKEKNSPPSRGIEPRSPA